MGDGATVGRFERRFVSTDFCAKVGFPIDGNGGDQPLSSDELYAVHSNIDTASLSHQCHS